MSIRATYPYESGLETTFGNVEADVTRRQGALPSGQRISAT